MSLIQNNFSSFTNFPNIPTEQAPSYYLVESHLGNEQPSDCRSLKNVWDGYTAFNSMCNGNVYILPANLLISYLEKENACALKLDLTDSDTNFEYEITEDSHALRLARSEDVYLNALLSKNGDLSITWREDNGLTDPSTGSFSFKNYGNGNIDLAFANGDVNVSGRCTSGPNRLKCSAADSLLSIFNGYLEMNYHEVIEENSDNKRYIMDFINVSPIPLLPAKDLGHIEVVVNRLTGAFTVDGSLKDPQGNVLFNSTIKHDVENSRHFNLETFKMEGTSSSDTQGRVFFIAPKLFSFDYNITSKENIDASGKTSLKQLQQMRGEGYKSDNSPMIVNEMEVALSIEVDPTVSESDSSIDFSYKTSSGSEESSVGLEINILTVENEKFATVDFVSSNGESDYSLNSKVSHTTFNGNDRYHVYAETGDSITEFTHSAKVKQRKE